MSTSSNQHALILARLTHIVRRFMEAEGLSLDLLNEYTNAASSGSERLPIGQWWALLERVAQVSNDPHVGLRIGKLTQIQDVGVLGYLAASCETLGQAMQRLQRFEGLLQQLAASSVAVDGDCIRLAWTNENGHSTDLSNEVLISGLLTVLGILIAPHRIKPVCVEFPRKSDSGLATYEAMLGCPVQFARPQLAVRLRADNLMLPINSRDTHLMQLLEQQAATALKGLEHSDEFLIQLQKAMSRGLLERNASMPWVAVQLNMSVRSVYRALNERGKTFKGQLDELRQTLAQQYLADETLSLSEIALLLGYSEQSAFNRAFRQWTGSTPLKHRREFYCVK
ncbi:AraC family transcriptional regulator [Pseudomonas neustonica]|jgi:AraC-like DNA-binding protein|uniref:AraC family transcriptional regulator n=1 Tax=Pseudomonadaceae TaxID=135621 RepID=UPI001E34CDBC|nr:AraC family transcriptional regulator [Halopseudomonas aestusnigri]MDL2200886.1 AraC family transcriptional regulator [Halopseudomonas aestusnigri]UGV30075.1 AraC family transcriptional regulator [Halopseudomonas aestusnigri]|tara:strand:- start:1470 stop:2486 length:1017 start_codon:yes stop_codon:yes gene_type:complete